MTNILRVEGLTKRFGGLIAVNNFSFDLEVDGIHSLIGPNGSGKTTTINLISGAIPADDGIVRLQENEITNEKPYIIAKQGLRRTFQDLKLFGSMTILENLMVGSQFVTKSGLIRSVIDFRTHFQEERHLREIAEDVLNFLGLYKLRHERVNSQPYGIQKMASIGVALASNPQLLLLDEPAAGLNPSERRNFVDIVIKIFEAKTKILLIEHNMDVVMAISKKITVLNFGAKIAEGAPDDIRENDEVIKAYLGRKYAKQQDIYKGYSDVRNQ